MKNEQKQLDIIKNQLDNAMEIVLKQKNRFEKIKSKKYGYTWTCEENGAGNEIAIGILGAIGNIECAIENLYNY